MIDESVRSLRPKAPILLRISQVLLLVYITLITVLGLFSFSTFYQRVTTHSVLEQFAATVRDETDLDTLTAELLRVIKETMQPEFVNITLFDRIDDGAIEKSV